MIGQILNRQAIEAKGYLACQDIRDELSKSNRQGLDAKCQKLLNRHGHPTYATLKHLVTAFDSDAKKPRR